LLCHFVSELKIIRVVEKQLCQHVICARRDFSFQVSPIFVLPAFAGRVPLWKTGYPNAETSMLVNVAHQFFGKLETVRPGPELSPARRISTQRQNVFYIQAANLIQELADF